METITVLKHAPSQLAIAGILALGLAGCGNQTVAFPTVTNSYVFVQTIAIPNVPASGWSEAYSSIDAADGYYLLSDRTNGAVDVVNLSTMTFARFAGAGSFVGNRTSPSNSAGPNDVVPIGGGNAAASDGNSNVVFVNLNSGATLGNVTVPNTGAAKNRVDLIGFDPDDNILMGANDAAKPSPVVSFISTIAPFPVLGTVALTGATGAEKPTYDPIQKKFLIGVPSTPANPGGEIDVFDPKTRALVKVYPLSNCGPAGTTMGPGEQLAVSCATLPTASVIIDATNGTVLGSVPDAAGCDQVWYNPGDNRYSFACSHTNPPNVTVADASTFREITTIPTVASANSVSVDPATNRIYIPERSGKTGIGLDVYAYL